MNWISFHNLAVETAICIPSFFVTVIIIIILALDSNLCLIKGVILISTSTILKKEVDYVVCYA